ncbi:hypothetical protein E2C01_035898 [Portunus trituberculatus]|uniref:Uncharacterized protein n=1 Tax=Portunus trituberculatus TaxID=210409 RepID=A0A5B7FAJ2_PORTR|nr:hypothetical protein [Portunus trituberculatus]
MDGLASRASPVRHRQAGQGRISVLQADWGVKVSWGMMMRTSGKSSRVVCARRLRGNIRTTASISVAVQCAMEVPS